MSVLIGTEKRGSSAYPTSPACMVSVGQGFPINRTLQGLPWFLGWFPMDQGPPTHFGSLSSSLLPAATPNK